MAARDELVVAVAGRYAGASCLERGRILDEFVMVTGLHRKHAMRLLRGGQPSQRSGPRPSRRVCDDVVRETLIVIWEASDRICGKWLRPLAPTLVEAMERHGHVQLAPEVRASLLAMSAATMDRCLREARGRTEGRMRRLAAPSAVVRRSVPVRTFEGWDSPALGYVEADLVAYSGPTARGSFVQTLTLTDIATGWMECAPVLVREQRLLTKVLGEVRKVEAVFATLDLVQLLQEVRAAQQGLVDLADRPRAGEEAAATAPTEVTLEQFLFGLRTAWRKGEVRPANRPKEKA